MGLHAWTGFGWALGQSSTWRQRLALSVSFTIVRSRGAADPHFRESEKLRAQRIVAGLGYSIIYLLGAASGILASVPVFALVFWIGSGNPMPKAEVALLFGAIFVGGWIAFGWCFRITNSLGDKVG